MMGGWGGGVGGAFLNLSSCPVSSVLSFLVAFGNDLLELQNLFFSFEFQLWLWLLFRIMQDTSYT